MLDLPRCDQLEGLISAIPKPPQRRGSLVAICGYLSSFDGANYSAIGLAVTHQHRRPEGS